MNTVYCWPHLACVASADLLNDSVRFLGSSKEVLIELGRSRGYNSMYVTGKRQFAASLPFKYGDKALDMGLSNGVR